MVKLMVRVPAQRRGRFWVWVLFVLGAASLWALPAVAQQTYTVNTTSDNTIDDNECTLREAILAANNDSAYNGDCGAASTNDDTITFSVSGTIGLSSQLPAIVGASTAGKLTIDGAGQSVTISGGSSVRVFEVNFGGDLTLRNLTVSNGRASFGGGIRNAGTVTITNSTISNNSAPLGGGIRNTGTVNIKNSIVGNNTAWGGPNCSGTLTPTGTNLATDSSCGMGFTQVASTGAGGLNLGPLANNGGSTQTHALLAGSVAIDAVSDCTPVTQDQRGVSRPQGARCDVRAFESAPARALTVSKLGTGSGTVTDNFSEIDCGGDCTGSYGQGAAVTLTTTPSGGSTFAGWSGDSDCSDGQVTMTADKSCIATFTLVYTLGDVNNDGKINTIDARMAQQHADGVITLTGNQFLAADVDQDGDVDSTDATAIAKKGIGLPTGIPGFAQLLPPSPQPSPWQGEGLLLALLPALLLLLRRSRRRVQELTAQGGLASLQGRITFPAGVAIQSVTGLNGFVVKALCGTVSEPCSSPNELRFSLVKPTAGGVMNGPVARLAVSASGAHGTVHTLSWSGSAQAPIVLGGDTNVEITGFTTGNGQVKVQ